MGWKDLKEEVRDFGVGPLVGNCIWQHGEHLDKDNSGSKDVPWKGGTFSSVQFSRSVVSDSLRPHEKESFKYII